MDRFVQRKRISQQIDPFDEAFWNSFWTGAFPLERGQIGENVTRRLLSRYSSSTAR
ncbi:MAG TPA: hypothetical protein VI913_05490 [Candidatus Peribacteraceae bacterium]|nr:hypothetical protein [Candidatus Peribacteraceae bacterium]